MKKTDYAATVVLKTGRSIKIWMPTTMNFSSSDFTEKTLFRFVQRGFGKAGSVALIPGGNIDYILVD